MEKPEVLEYYNELKARHELTRSDVSIYPSYTHLKVPYSVICRQRYHKAGVKQRLRFIKEIKIHEALQHRALDGVRVHREFCNPILVPPDPSEIIKFTPEEELRLGDILDSDKQLSNQFFKMFANAFQSGFISVFYSVGSNPLSIWDKYVKNGHIRRLVDEEVKSLVLEISGVNVATTYITCPVKPRASLGIKLPFLVMVVKNMKKYFSFEIQIADDKDMRRRFRVSNFQSTTKVRPFLTTMPIGLSSGWNQIQFNLADFTKRAYGSTYIETVRIQIHANVRLRRIYFSDRLYSDDELPNEFKLFLPAPGTHRRQPKTESDKRLSTEGIQVLEGEIPSVAPPATPCDEGSEEGYYEDVFGLGAPFSVRVEPPEPLDIDEDEDEDEGEGRAHLDEARLEELPVEKEPNEEERPAEAEDVEEPVATEAVAEGAPMTEEPPPTEESPPAEEAALEEAPPAEEQPPADETPQIEEPPPE